MAASRLLGGSEDEVGAPSGADRTEEDVEVGESFSGGELLVDLVEVVVWVESETEMEPVSSRWREVDAMGEREDEDGAVDMGGKCGKGSVRAD